MDAAEREDRRKHARVLPVQLREPQSRESVGPNADKGTCLLLFLGVDQRFDKAIWDVFAAEYPLAHALDHRAVHFHHTLVQPTSSRPGRGGNPLQWHDEVDCIGVRASERNVRNEYQCTRVLTTHP